MSPTRVTEANIWGVYQVHDSQQKNNTFQHVASREAFILSKTWTSLLRKIRWCAQGVPQPCQWLTPAKRVLRFVTDMGLFWYVNLKGWRSHSWKGRWARGQNYGARVWKMKDWSLIAEGLQVLHTLRGLVSVKNIIKKLMLANSMYFVITVVKAW